MGIGRAFRLNGQEGLSQDMKFVCRSKNKREPSIQRTKGRLFLAPGDMQRS